MSCTCLNPLNKAMVFRQMFPSFPSNINGNFRILNWRYCTICLAIFSGDIHLHRPYIYALYMVGTSNLGTWHGHPSHVFFEKRRMAIPPTSAAPWFADTARSNGRPVPAGCPPPGGDLRRSYGNICGSNGNICGYSIYIYMIIWEYMWI